jgi:hypothetical protein
MATTFVLEAAISEAGASDAVIGGGFPNAEPREVESPHPVRLFVLQRATDTLPRSTDLDRYGRGVRYC